MTDKPSTKQTDSDEKPITVRDTLAETRTALQQGKSYHAKQAADYGAALDEFNRLREVPASQLEPYAQGFASYLRVIKELQASQPNFNVASSAIAMTGTAATVAPSIAEAGLPHYWKLFSERPPLWDSTRSAHYAAKLERLDPELGRLYRGISEAFLGLTENPERAAFGLARQCFDHLFDVLVPDDDEVRRSSYFEVKTSGRDPNAVSRVERIKFAAGTCIRDRAVGEYLGEQATQLLRAYSELQSLHDRAPIERERARGILKTFIASLDQWIDALEP